jgi:acyl transferase domain-containing protein
MEQIISNNIIKNDTSADNIKNAVYLNCPILTTSGIIEEKLDIHGVVIYPGNIKQIENSELFDDKLVTLVEMNINENPVESIITALAKIYTLGSRYNPNKLVTGMEKKVTLPTYPFENETYKVSFEEEVTLDNSDLDNTSQKKMLKIDINHTLSDVERKSSSNELANDLKMFS